MSMRWILGSLSIVSLMAMAACQSPSKPAAEGPAQAGAAKPRGVEPVAVGKKAGAWGVALRGRGRGPGGTVFWQDAPLRVEWCEDESHIVEGSGSYSQVNATPSGFTGCGRVEVTGVSFQFDDEWTTDGQGAVLHRTVKVTGSAKGGFLTSVAMGIDPRFDWPDLDYFAPGAIYGGTQGLLEHAQAGWNNYHTGRLLLREDSLPMPLFGASLRDGRSIAVLDAAPRGDTTAEESHDQAGKMMVDERFTFGAVGGRQLSGGAGGVEVGFWFPGTTYRVWLDDDDKPHEGWVRRYHPVRDGFVQKYTVAFRIGEEERFHDFYTRAWRWGWQMLKPAPDHYDIEMVRRTLTDQLASTAMSSDGRTGLPFAIDAVSGKIERPTQARGNALMGFVGKNLESAAWFLYEADRDPSPRGAKLRQLGNAIMDSFVKLKMAPPEGEGFNIFTGKPAVVIPKGYRPGYDDRIYLRALVEDMHHMLWAYRYEQQKGRQHPTWLAWCRSFADWLLPQQRADGSFPRAWGIGTGEPVGPSPTASYNPIAFLTLLGELTGDKKYIDSALRAGEFCWITYHNRDAFIGGTLDNPDILDKEAGGLSLQAYLSLYENSKDSKWLRRAVAAADYTETWMWAWSVSMPPDEDDAKLHWKKGVSMVGVNRINSTGSGVDQWMAENVDLYARLYRYTGDPHDLEVARILLHNTKNMVALPGRPYDLAGLGWQQEHWHLFPRGYGSHRLWLPWVTANHLGGIIAAEAFDPDLFKELSGK